jgi:hypothetical protein
MSVTVTSVHTHPQNTKKYSVHDIHPGGRIRSVHDVEVGDDNIMTIHGTTDGNFVFCTLVQNGKEKNKSRFEAVLSETRSAKADSEGYWRIQFHVTCAAKYLAACHSFPLGGNYNGDMNDFVEVHVVKVTNELAGKARPLMEILSSDFTPTEIWFVVSPLNIDDSITFTLAAIDCNTGETLGPSCTISVSQRMIQNVACNLTNASVTATVIGQAPDCVWKVVYQTGVVSPASRITLHLPA